MSEKSSIRDKDELHYPIALFRTRQYSQ